VLPQKGSRAPEPGDRETSGAYGGKVGRRGWVTVLCPRGPAGGARGQEPVPDWDGEQIST
jgi:hypothetical protein